MWILCCLAVSAPAAAQSPGTLTNCHELLSAVEGFDSISDVLFALRRDPFADAFGVYIGDLEPLDREGRNLAERMQRVERQDCQPYVDELLRWETLRAELVNSGCTSAGLPADAAAACNTRVAGLASWRERVEVQRRSAQVKIDSALAASVDFAARAAMPLRNAQNVLDPDRTEDAFHLHIWWVLKTEGTPPQDSCRAFAGLATALGRRVQNQELFIDWLVRNVVDAASPLRYLVAPPAWRPAAGRTFDATGFQSRFTNNRADNQVRHAAAHMRIGYSLTGGAAAVYSLQDDLAAKYVRGRAPEWDDYYLALAAAWLGRRLHNGELRTSDFGDAIRAELCE